jgi:hypothetical protein
MGLVWAHGSLHSCSPGRCRRTYRFHIRECKKPNSCFNRGQQPLGARDGDSAFSNSLCLAWAVYSEMAAAQERIGWRHFGTDVCYYQVGPAHPVYRSPATAINAECMHAVRLPVLHALVLH